MAGGKDLPFPASSKAPRAGVRSWIPTAWFRRRRFALALLVFVVVGFLLYAGMPWPVSRTRQAGLPHTPAATKRAIAALLREIPGAVPGVPPANGTDSGRQGRPYPSHTELTMLLNEQLSDPAFRVDESEWAEWRHWVEHHDAAWPSDAHVQFLETLVMQPSSGLDDVRLVRRDALTQFLEYPAAWERKHVSLFPLTVISKSYCPYSRAAKALLTDLGARYAAYDVDLRVDAHMIQTLTGDLTGHRTFPKVLTGGTLLELHAQGLLTGILRGVGALDS